MSKALISFGKRLGIFLAELRWTHEELAKRAGIYRHQVSSIVSGKGNPTIETLEKIAGAMGRPIADFFKEEVTISSISVPRELAAAWSAAPGPRRELALKILQGQVAAEAALKPKKQS